MRSNFLISAIVVLLVVESAAIVLLADNQSKFDDLILSAAEYRSRLIALHSSDMVYFRLFYVNVGGRTLTVPLTVSGADYMDLRDRVRQNLTVGYEQMDYQQFVTPSDPTISGIKARLRATFPADLDYAEAVLDIVHQLYYYSPPSGNWYMKYPTETLVEGSGLCAHLSVLAASLLKSAGIDTILIVYQNPEAGQSGHMNIGIGLDTEPFPGAYYVERSGKKYYVAETTNSLFNEQGGFTWEGTWRVGQQPSFLSGWSIVTIEA